MVKYAMTDSSFFAKFLNNSKKFRKNKLIKPIKSYFIIHIHLRVLYNLFSSFIFDVLKVITKKNTAIARCFIIQVYIYCYRSSSSHIYMYVILNRMYSFGIISRSVQVYRVPYTMYIYIIHNQFFGKSIAKEENSSDKGKQIKSCSRK